MASGDTDVSICSDACLLLGAGTISSFTDGYDKSTVCSRLYPDIRDTVLGMREWSFSVVKSVLARNVTAPINEWSYKYDLPGDLNVGPIAAYNSSSSGATPITSWERIGNYVYTNEETIYIDYQKIVTESLMPAYFVNLLKYAMASVIAETVTDQITKAEYWHKRAFGAEWENGRGGQFRIAAQMDGANNVTQTFENFELVLVRNGGR
jgi:hypothetical protein